jgi:hypothetical protein
MENCQEHIWKIRSSYAKFEYNVPFLSITKVSEQRNPMSSHEIVVRSFFYLPLSVRFYMQEKSITSPDSNQTYRQ